MLSHLISSVLNKKLIYFTELNIINQCIEKILSATKVPNNICQIILNSGKRIRSLLALDLYYKCNSVIPKYLFKILALIELTHFASLLHDDVIDKNNIRRGNRSVYNMYGSKKTILLGDYLLIKIFNEITKLQLGQYVTDGFIKTASAISYGAWLEQNLKPTCNFNEYIKVVSLKTSAPFRFASTIGLWDADNVAKIGTYATCFGIIYQVQNDINDYNIEIFENSEDYVQSNVTYPVVVLFKKYPYLFTEKTQKNFSYIKKLIHSEEFKRRILTDLSKYLKCLTDTDVYIK